MNIKCAKKVGRQLLTAVTMIFMNVAGIFMNASISIVIFMNITRCS